MNYQFYVREGNLYTHKSQKTPRILLIIVMLALAVWAWSAGIMAAFYVCLAFAIIAAFSIYSKKLVIDTNRRVIIYRKNIFSEGEVPFDDFDTFEVNSHKYMGLITINVLLNAHFIVNGKDVSVNIGQALGTGTIQKMLNETNEILKLS